FDSTGTTLIASGVALADGRNESFLATGLTAGATYKIRVQGEGGTSGEYFLGLPPVTPSVSSYRVNDGNIQRSMVTGITVFFNQAVTLDAGAITLGLHAGVSISGGSA